MDSQNDEQDDLSQLQENADNSADESAKTDSNDTVLDNIH
jgi:hypothetical protein